MTPDAAWTKEETNQIRKKAYHFFLWDGYIWKHPKKRDGVVWFLTHDMKISKIII